MLDLNWKHGFEIIDCTGRKVGGDVKIIGSSGDSSFAFVETREGLYVFYGWANRKTGKIFQGPFVNYTIVPKQAPVREGWLNICLPDGNDPEDFVVSVYPTKEKADRDPCWLRKKIACIKIQFTEGEGL